MTVLTEGLAQRYPNIVLNFVEGHFETLYPQVENGKVDVTFVGTPAESAPVTLQRHVLARSAWRALAETVPEPPRGFRAAL